jgi:hypothetical protein
MRAKISSNIFINLILINYGFMMLPISYECDKSIEVYFLSKEFIENSDVKEKISELCWVYHSIGDLIPHTTESFWSGHFFPWTESWKELQISYNLCLFGFYKQAMVSLRSALELGLLSVYWNLNDDGYKIIREWLKSEKDTPNKGAIWKKLEEHKNFRLFQQKIDIKNRIFQLGFLSNYVHSKGHHYSNSIGLLKSNLQTFEVKGFNNWFDAFEEVVKVLSILHLIKYPIGVVKFNYHEKFGIDTPMFGGLNEFKIEWIKKLISKEEFNQIEMIAQTDETVKEILEWISQLPDMSEDEREQQIIDWDKEEICRQGLESWLKNENSFSEILKNDEKYQKRLEYLICWAKENNLEKPIWERK